MSNVKIVLHRIIFCSTYRQNTHSQRRPKQPTMMSGSGSSWAWSRMGLLSSGELGLLPLMIAPCRVLVMRQGGKRPHSEWLGLVCFDHLLISPNENSIFLSSQSEDGSTQGYAFQTSAILHFMLQIEDDWGGHGEDSRMNRVSDVTFQSLAYAAGHSGSEN